MDPFMHYGMGAGIQAVADSGLDFAKENGDRCGAIMGSGIGGLAGIEDEAITWERTHNPKKTSPFYIPSTIGNMVAGHLSIRFGLRGPNLGVVSACTTSTHAIGLAMRCHPVRRRGHHHRRWLRVRHHADRAGRLQPGQGAVGAQRRPAGRQPAVGQGPRRLRHGRRRRRGHPRRTRARQGARCAHLRRVRRLRHERRCLSHHGSAGRRRRRAARDGERAARRANESHRHPLPERARHLDAARRQGRDGGHQERVRRPRLQAARSARPSR